MVNIIKKYRLLYLIIFSLLWVSCKVSPKLESNYSPSFSKAESRLIMAGDSSKTMRIFKINNSSDSILLRSKSLNVIANPKDKVLKNLVNRMYRTVRDSLSMGVGIAAPQLGISRNVILLQRFDKDNSPFEAYLNPKITFYSEKKQKCLEGCLSIPNRSDVLNSRSYSIVVDYDKMDASHHRETINGFTAVIFQHEIDHLNGILYLDHLANEIKSAKDN